MVKGFSTSNKVSLPSRPHLLSNSIKCGLRMAMMAPLDAFLACSALRQCTQACHLKCTVMFRGSGCARSVNRHLRNCSPLCSLSLLELKNSTPMTMLSFVCPTLERQWSPRCGKATKRRDFPVTSSSHFSAGMVRFSIGSFEKRSTSSSSLAGSADAQTSGASAEAFAGLGTVDTSATVSDCAGSGSVATTFSVLGSLAIAQAPTMTTP
mmetsp:Transcript_21068/g.46357  ORF Transcript_21068/g.46357 Transcript_21068/m.46357 type:complete len:209 (+) Transcript_21068:552-1178(+)